MMQTSREYAEALFMLAAEEKKTKEYSECLEMIKAVIEKSPDYIDFLASPAVSLSERVGALDEAFGEMPEYIVSFVKLLCENGHMRSLLDCIEEFNDLMRSAANKTVATVYCAVSLSDGQKAALCEKLEKMSGKSIEPVYILDESLIGGIKIEIEGKTYDGSLKRRLYEVKEVMNG